VIWPDGQTLGVELRKLALSPHWLTGAKAAAHCSPDFFSARCSCKVGRNVTCPSWL
jgi:hypothetical protein